MAQRHPSLFIADSDLHGKGVFAAEFIEIGTLIEICPVIVLPKKDMKLIHKTKLHDYYFLWGEDEQQVGIIMGYGSLYNHSYDPNVEYIPDYEGHTLSFYCYKNIEIGEEILVNYNGTPTDLSPLWFTKPNT